MPTMHDWLRCYEGMPVAQCDDYRRLWLALDDAEQRSFIPRPADVPQFPAPVGLMTRVKLPPLVVDFSTPSTGVGDSVAKLLIVTRLSGPAAKAIKWWFRVNDCGCRARQATWNKRLPWPAWWQRSVGRWLKAWA